MAKPKRIILVRHGESEGNLDKTIYTKKPDFALDLTENGLQQAKGLGGKLNGLLYDRTKNRLESVWFYRSPFYRARQTHEMLRAFLPNSRTYEDPRLREQEHTPKILSHWNLFSRDTWVRWLSKIGINIDSERAKTSRERDEYGHFYYRFNGGESCADVYDRLSDFLGTLYRDFEKPEFGENCIIVCHGMTMRVFLMRLLHMTVEEFEFLRNPKNCGYYILELQENGKYELSEEPEKYKDRNCKY
jgi:broad specificity phosphatase PhoE